MAKNSPLMTSAEARCFQAARALQREDVIDGLKLALLPQLPLFKEAMQHSVSTRLVYFSLILVGLPIILLYWLAQLGFRLLIFPWRYYSTWLFPSGFAPPGERNIQGMHNAWSRYVRLSTPRYVQCVNAWAHILYGKEAANKHRFEKYFDMTLLEHTDPGGQAAAHLKNSLRIAREQVSKNLGYY
jgi:hypothetical protein